MSSACFLFTFLPFYLESCLIQSGSKFLLCINIIFLNQFYDFVMSSTFHCIPSITTLPPYTRSSFCYSNLYYSIFCRNTSTKLK